MATVYNLTSLTTNKLLSLIPCERVEQILGKPVEWSTATTPKKVWNAPFNHDNDIVISDAHERFRGEPSHRNPLYKHYSTHSDKAQLGKLVGYQHNQVAI